MALRVSVVSSSFLGSAEQGKADEKSLQVLHDLIPGRLLSGPPQQLLHDRPHPPLEAAPPHAGVNSNVLADTSLIDPLSGNAVLNGIPVDVTPA